ncbi:exodeoxyribonuclease VII large subunit [Sulfurimonas lithotrophica]|uniref:Exodeoxyribonuclease 7 large subunit n=1 Tax=Sulfurimonas lithotrophica TaxID=2590022 RepID=A0A5P8P1J9_9BACT|nr:exodeoxyribonuclease VII large subunit [Sulfurimonas lithotrophica]QFR49602.1 exodeoxyribonuclease VII large subunit [Sulfurimonas lithotrophica]
MNTLSVSALNEQIKTLLETSFTRVLVEGELSRITFHNSGHIYFTLKDSSSAISAVMFRGNASRLKFQLQEGMKVILEGAVSVYTPRGSYQINCFNIEPAGQGALALAYEQLKQKLQDKGYFNPETKKQLPKFPRRIALITSATGAALQDMLRVANHRYRDIEIDIYDVLVQGESAASSIASAIDVASVKNYDILVVGRGGGSMEDLWAFNEEIVADAIFASVVPVVSAVGHEIDTVISDFVADLRAPTPSAAMQMILPDEKELYQYLDSISNQFTQIIEQKIDKKNQELSHLKQLYKQNSIENKLTQKIQEIKSLKESFYQQISFKISNKQNELTSVLKNLESNNPKYKTKRGFAQLSRNKKVIDISELKIDDDFELMDDKVVIYANVLKKENIG